MRSTELCDRYGIYVIDETNLETHGVWDAIVRIQADPDDVVPKDHREYSRMLLDRVNSSISGTRTIPAVLIWSCGNER